MDLPPLKVFIIYAHEDRAYKDDLLKSLKLLQKKGLVATWHDRDLLAGDEWEKVIRGHLQSAHLILPIISIDFFNSDYIEQVEKKIWLIPPRLTSTQTRNINKHTPLLANSVSKPYPSVASKARTTLASTT